MADAHLSAEQLEAYVIGALETDAAAAVEAHVAACAGCAERLAREARLERALADVAALPAPRRARRWVAPLAAGVALAAGLALFVVHQQRADPGDGEPRLVRCEDPRSATDCVAKAQFDGLLSLGPGAVLEVPRYEDVPAVKRGVP